MSTKPNKTADFLKAMQQGEPPAEVLTAPPAGEAPVALHAPAAARPAPRGKATKAGPPTRVGRKHFGGYLGDDTLEKIALLRVRLKKDNSELIEFAIEELYRKHNAKRAFGDA